jgi:hypothetical protein
VLLDSALDGVLVTNAVPYKLPANRPYAKPVERFRPYVVQ